MPHSYALRAMKLLLFLDVSTFFSESPEELSYKVVIPFA